MSLKSTVFGKTAIQDAIIKKKKPTIHNIKKKTVENDKSKEKEIKPEAKAEHRSEPKSEYAPVGRSEVRRDVKLETITENSKFSGKADRESSESANGINASNSVVNIKFEWDYNKILENYNKHGMLPPPLSPTIPYISDSSPEMEIEDSVEKSDKRSRPKEPANDKRYVSMPRMLSPTLPSIFNDEKRQSELSGKRDKKVFINKTGDRFVVKIFYKIEPQKKGLGIEFGTGKVKIGVMNHNGIENEIVHELNTPSNRSYDKNKQILLDKIKHWNNLATKKKHQSDNLKSSNLKLSIITNIDSILLYIISFNYEDLHKKLINVNQVDKNWLTLIPYITFTINNCEEVGWTSIQGLLYFIKAIILKHSINLNTKIIKIYENEANIEKITFLYSKNSKNFQKLLSSLSKSEALLNISVLKNKYPHTFQNRYHSPNPPKFKESINPLKDYYYLPLSVNTSLNEISCFCYHFVKEFCGLEKMNYILEVEK